MNAKEFRPRNDFEVALAILIERIMAAYPSYRFVFDQDINDAWTLWKLRRIPLPYPVVHIAGEDGATIGSKLHRPGNVVIGWHSSEIGNILTGELDWSHIHARMRQIS